LGQEILRKSIVAEKTVFQLRGIWNGIYFYRVEIEGKMYSGKIVIQK